jgi:precorrin-6A/cobalt-precorrin-6A reductase
MRLLILGGTTEASALAKRLPNIAGIEPLLSLAGRTERPATAIVPMRVGGFGGVDGLARFLREERIGAVVDATHPFAARISANAVEACAATRTPLIAFTRPAWEAVPGDRWTSVASPEAAATALGREGRRVFLTVGRLSLDAFAAAGHHLYVVRAIDAPRPIRALPRHRLILARGPFGLAEEMALMKAEGIEILVSKNSGGAATYAKIEAARLLGLPVIMIERPNPPRSDALTDVEAVIAWIEAHRSAS